MRFVDSPSHFCAPGLTTRLVSDGPGGAGRVWSVARTSVTSFGEGTRLARAGLEGLSVSFVEPRFQFRPEVFHRGRAGRVERVVRYVVDRAHDPAPVGPVRCMVEDVDARR